MHPCTWDVPLPIDSVDAIKVSNQLAVVTDSLDAVKPQLNFGVIYLKQILTNLHHAREPQRGRQGREGDWWARGKYMRKMTQG